MDQTCWLLHTGSTQIHILPIDDWDQEGWGPKPVVYQCSGAIGDGDERLAYVIMIRKDRPAKEGESVLMIGDSSSAVQWVINCVGGKGDEGSRGMTRTTGVLEPIGGWSFQANMCGAWRTF